MNDSNRVVFDLTFTEDAFNDLPYGQRLDNLVKLLVVISNRFDLAQRQVIAMAYQRFLDNAEGNMLDGVASRFFIERQGKSDEEMKAAIKLFSLRQDSEVTRTDVVRLLKIIVGEGAPLNIYKGPNNYLQVAVSTECLDLTKIRLDLEELFPINTNLELLKINSIRKPFGLGSALLPSINSDKIGLLGTSTKPKDTSNYMAVTIISNENGR